MRRVVLDTNVLISALLFRGSLFCLVDFWKTGRIKPYFSAATFSEFSKVLHYPKFALTEEEIAIILRDEIFPFFEVVDVPCDVLRLCQDPDDDMFIACALAAGAEAIVMGDAGLHLMGEKSPVKIMTASELIEN